MTENHELSPREQEILALVAQGLTNREIAQKLSISPNTVKVHLSNIFSKTGVASRTEATLYGIEHGLVEVPGGGESREEPRKSLNILRDFRWVWVMIAALFLLILFTMSTNLIFPPPAPEPATGQDLAERWQKLDPLPEPLRGMAVAAYDGDVFTLGGEVNEGVSSAVYSYDFDLGDWQRKADKPTPVADVQGVTIGEKIYVPGGKLDDNSLTDVLEIYNPRADAWEKGAPLPKPVSAYALADFEGQMYLFGGWNGNKEVSTVYVYDPDSDTWKNGQPMKQARAYARAVAQEDKIVLIGGRRENQAISDVSAYYPTRDAIGDDPWVVFIDLPEPRYAFGAAGVADNIYLICGKPMHENVRNAAGLLMNGQSWVDLPTEPNFNGHESTMVSLGSLLAILDSTDKYTDTFFWTYKAFFFSIYIPLVP